MYVCFSVSWSPRINTAGVCYQGDVQLDSKHHPKQPQHEFPRGEKVRDRIIMNVCNHLLPIFFGLLADLNC